MLKPSHNSTFTTLSLFTLASILLLVLASIGLKENGLAIDWEVVLFELDQYGCIHSPDNLGCELNRPIDEERRSAGDFSDDKKATNTRK
ncbi:MAG: hypothetical protein F6K58_04375 [Symploca sp. SIO2E9]|nr:hypothetical protein [Symploca sp. SIO2E9]